MNTDADTSTFRGARRICFSARLALALLLALCAAACSGQDKGGEKKESLFESIPYPDQQVLESTESLRRNPRDGNAYCNRGQSYRLKGELDKAIADLDEAIRLNPKSGFAYYQRGLTYRSMNELKRAISDFTEAIRLDPDFYEAHFHREVLRRDQPRRFGAGRLRRGVGSGKNEVN